MAPDAENEIRGQVVGRGVVRPEWIDYNGHMNVAYYVLAFDHATDAFFDYVGLDRAYREATANTTFAVDARVTYQQEVGEGDRLRFATQLLGYDDKRLHFFHQMVHAEKGFLAATSEWVGLHIDLSTRRVSPMPEAIRGRLAEVLEAHRALAVPLEVGRPLRRPDISRL